MIDKEKASQIFLDYADGYDRSNILIEAKVQHTLRVADIAEQIAQSLSLAEEDCEFSWFLGLLHDIARFEQLKRYGTFVDRHSIDHAELGADILFQEGLADSFGEAGFEAKDHPMAEKAIRLHNKLTLPEDLSEREALFCNLLRDADKVDIFRVLNELPLEQRLGKSRELVVEKEKASPEIMGYISRHQCIPRKLVSSPFEHALAHGCMGFELVYAKSRSLVEEQGYLEKLLEAEDEEGKPRWNPEEEAQLAVLKDELKKAWKDTKE